MIVVNPGTGYEVLANIPTWMPGECLFGWCARYHDVHGFRNEATSIALFGKPRVYRTRSLPSGLGRFVSVTMGTLGSPEQILWERTAASAYRPFLSDLQRGRVAAAAQEIEGPSIFQVLGLPGSRMGSQTELRHCLDCHRGCLAEHGESIRLTKHQLPAVWYCDVHESTLYVQPHQGVGFALPDDGEGAIHPSVKLSDPRDQRERHALALCSAIAEFISTLDRIDVSALIVDCLHRLEDIGICNARRLNAAALDHWFNSSPIGQWIARSGVQRLPAGWIAKLLRERASPNPLTWTLLWSAIWEGLTQGQALEAFAAVASGRSVLLRPTLPFHEGGDLDVFSPADRHADSEQTVRLASGESVDSVAQAAGKSAEDVERIFFDRPEARSAALRHIRRMRFAEARARIELHLINHPGDSAPEIARALPDDVWFVMTNRKSYWKGVLEHIGVGPSTKLSLF